MRCERCGRFSTVCVCEGKDISRSTDPETSKAAGEQITSSGQRQSVTRRIIEHAFEHPGQHVIEIADGLELTQYQVSKRLSDAIKTREIEYGVERDGKATVWPAAGSHPLKGQTRLGGL